MPGRHHGTTEQDPAEEVLLFPVEVLIAVFASATLGYHVSVLFQLPVKLAVVPVLLCLAALCPWLLTRSKTLRSLEGVGGLALGVLLLGSSLAVFTLVTSRPDADDVQFFHRGLKQVERLDEPFIVADQTFDVPDLPRSAAGVVAVYELLVALAAHTVGTDPLQAYHNVVPVVAALLVVLVYVLLYRRSGLDRLAACAATACVFVFLFFDANLHRSLGNVTIMRLWHGKALIWTLCLPWVLLLVRRYWERPGPGRWLPICLLAIAAVGLSGSGLFLVPALVLAAGLAQLLVGGITAQHLKTFALLMGTLGYSALLLMLMITGVLENLDLASHFAGWPGTWASNVALVVDGPAEWARGFVLLFLVPWLCPRSSMGKYLVVLSGIVLVLFFNPWTGAWLLKWLTAGAYWRLAYLFPLPLCAGLTIACLRWRGARPRRVLAQVSVAALALLAVGFASRHSVLAPSQELPPVWLKRPWELRFVPQDLAFSRAVRERVRGRHLLAPTEIVVPLALLVPSATFESARSFQTARRFTLRGQPEEGRRRVAAQQAISECTRTPAAEAALVQSVRGGVDRIIVRDCGAASLDRLMELLLPTGRWDIAENVHGYVLLSGTTK